MSKPISISFGKSKSGTSSPSTHGLSSKPLLKRSAKPSATSLRHDSDDEDEAQPEHQSITAFEANGAVFSESKPEKEQPVIPNAGNADWRKRGRGHNLLPAEVQVQRNAERVGEIVTRERDEVSKASGLQYAETQDAKQIAIEDGDEGGRKSTEPAKPLTDDERALRALLGKDGAGSQTIIASGTNERGQPYDDTADFRADVASRPDSCTVEEYAAMPVEGFGMAMLRGMGKRRANGEIVNYSHDQANERPLKIPQPRQGYLGIGAKAAPGAETELGAWGKSAMRKNDKGEGFYTPLMMKNTKTGEMVTEEELERRRKDAKEASGRSKDSRAELDWRERRDRNLERSGRDRNGDQKLLMDPDEYKEQMSSFGSRPSSSGRDREGYGSERSRREKDRSRSRSRDRDRRRHDDDDYRYRERRKDRYKDDERYDSSSSRRSDHRDRHRDDRNDKRRRDR